MPDVRCRTLAGGEVALKSSSVQTLADSLQGDLLNADSGGYDEARTIWNAMIDRRPALIALCENTDDVQETVGFARAHGLLTSVRGGGHNIAGNAVSEGGLMINLSRMNRVAVDPESRRALVGPGASLGTMDAATQTHGLATPLGINSTTGVAGLTLGGGFGWLTRKHGMTVDNLRSVEVVTADGAQRVASARENPDLFWALRGGGGNFGVATSFEFELHEVGPQVLSGLVVYPLEQAGDVLREYRAFAAEAPDELTVWCVLRKAPPLPFLPEEVHGTEVLVLAMLHTGTLAEAEPWLEPLVNLGSPIAVAVVPHEYAAFQQAFDPLLTPGARNYWKSHDFAELSDGLIDTAIDFTSRLPSPHTEIFIAQLGGAMNRVDAGDTAYPFRESNFTMNVHGRWEDVDGDEAGISWCRDFFEASEPFATGGVYVNFMTEDEGDRVRSAYGPNYDRLVEMKRRYDPENLFRLNQNIAP